MIETHTKKIHLLIVDQSLTDYHHEHPRLTEHRAITSLNFLPLKRGPYLDWADVRPTPLGLQEYDKTVIPGRGQAGPLTDRKTQLSADVEGFFELLFEKPTIKVGQATEARLRITKADGSGFNQLEPVMATFAHVVGFSEDGETVLHLHPTGAPVVQESARGGPELKLKISAAKAGLIRLFVQVQIGGRQMFAPFGVRVEP